MRINVANVLMLTRHRSPRDILIKAVRVLRREGWRRLFTIAAETLFDMSYGHWIKEYDTLDDTDRMSIRAQIDQFANTPLISVLMPVYEPSIPLLERAIMSVQQQLYSNWELCIADDGSRNRNVRRFLQQACEADSRIKVVFRSVNGHISAASNSALELVSGEFVALLDQDDELSEHALYMAAAVLNSAPNVDIIYSDEDKIDARGIRFSPYFKPDWNPDLFLAHNLISHLGIYRTSLVREVGGFREGFEGSQDWDLALRIVARTHWGKIVHIPNVLYHWRAVEGSTALGVEQKSYARDAARAALEDRLERMGITGQVELAAGGHFRIRYALPENPPLVSVVVPTRNGYEHLERCLSGLFRQTDYPSMEVVVVDNGSDDARTLEYLEELEDCAGIRLLRYDYPFNFSAINNYAIARASGEIVCLLNNDIKPISSGWLREMVSHAVRDGIGAVGAMLYYPDDTIQHAGIFLDGCVAGHFYLGHSRGVTGDMGRAALVQNVTAVTGACLVVRKDLWMEVGGMDEENLAVAFNDVDFCLKLQERGYRNLWTPYAEMYHFESATRGADDVGEKKVRFTREMKYMRARWGSVLSEDPAVNPNRSFRDPTRLFASPPRVRNPWERVAGLHDSPTCKPSRPLKNAGR